MLDMCRVSTGAPTATCIDPATHRVAPAVVREGVCTPHTTASIRDCTRHIGRVAEARLHNNAQQPERQSRVPQKARDGLHCRLTAGREQDLTSLLSVQAGGSTSMIILVNSLSRRVGTSHPALVTLRMLKAMHAMRCLPAQHYRVSIPEARVAQPSARARSRLDARLVREAGCAVLSRS